MTRRRFALASIAAVLLLAAWPARARAAGTLPPPTGFVERPTTRATLDALRTGGFVLYLRHGHTDNTRPDRLPAVDVEECDTQRPLSEDGRRSAAAVGLALRTAAIPIGDIHVSRLCRARDTAAAAFAGHTLLLEDLLIYTGNMTAAGKAPILARTAALLSAPVATGGNRVVVAHAPNIMDLIGYFPAESTLVVFRPRGGGRFEYLASIPWTLWPGLLAGR